MPKEIDSVSASSRDRPRWSDFVASFEFASNDWHLVRPFGLIWTDYRHVIVTAAGKRYYDHCAAWDPEKDVWDDQKACLYCGVQTSARTGAAGALITGQHCFYVNVLHYEPDFDTFQHRLKGIFLLEMTSSLFKRVRDLKTANNNFPVTHAQRGALILIKCDRNAEPANRYAASLDTKSLSLDEAAYAIKLRQKRFDGSVELIEAANNLPPMWSYQRVLTPLDEVYAALVRHGYLPARQRASTTAQAIVKPLTPPAEPRRDVLYPAVVARAEHGFDNHKMKQEDVPPVNDNDDSLMPY